MLLRAVEWAIRLLRRLAWCIKVRGLRAKVVRCQNLQNRVYDRIASGWVDFDGGLAFAQDVYRERIRLEWELHTLERENKQERSET